ncbi:MAG: hypothetical protein K8S56_01095 [Candidatus Cloacimonetes bacterium]|nr:hypothetical protein [Candidatus Cloacimonadota bacterium]
MVRIIVAIMCLLALSGLWADKYAGEIFRIDPGVRNNALGGCGIADPNTFAPAYWNPALLALNNENRIELMHAEEFMGLLRYDTVSGVYKGVALTLLRIGIDDVPLTRKAIPGEPLSNTNRPYAYDSVTNADYIIYAGLHRKIGRVNVGFTPKLAYRNLVKENGFGFGLDIATFFEIHSHVLLAARLRDVTTTQVFWQNGTHETVNPGLDVETRLHFVLPWISKDLFLFSGIETYTEGREEAATTSLGFLSLDYHAGLEFVVNKGLSLYGGYNISDITAGLTLTVSRFNLNYNFEQNTELDNSHRFSIGVKLP